MELGPWQAFERDTARLLIAHGFDDVRLVAGTGDRGADVLGVKNGQLWVVQCKFTLNTPPTKRAVEEAVAGAAFYGAHRILVATSRVPGEAFDREVQRFKRKRLNVEVLAPRTLLAMAEQAPKWAPARKTLRRYQEDVAERLRNALLETGRGQIVMATGLGKTVVLADTVADLLTNGLVEEGRVLVLAHTCAIVDQLQRAFWFQLPKTVSTHRLSEGEFPSFWEGITFATIQSALAHVGRLPRFGLVLVDEAHHIGAITFRETIAKLAPPKLAGVTATPWRGDGYDIDEILGPPLEKIGIADGLQKGFLSDVDYRLLADDLDWKFIQRLSRHRYSLKELNRRLIIPTRDEEAARLIRQVFHDEKRRAGIVFSPTIEHATDFAAMLRHRGLATAVVSSRLDARERDKLMAQFKAGQLDFVTTVDLFNEGVDIPDVDMLVFMRVTHSRRIFVQQLGRGLRPTPGKDKVIVLDFVTDLRRVAEVIDLDKSVRGDEVERVGLGPRLVQFQDRSAGSFLREWILDQASLFQRQEESTLELPHLDFPAPASPGGIQ